MGASKFPSEQNSKLVDENGLPISATNPLEVDIKNTTVPISGTVTANVTFPTTQTIKIDQTTAGANNIHLVDKTNNTHVAKVDANGSVSAKITNDTAAAIPTTITNTPSVNATIQNTSIPVTGTFFQATQPISGNVGITGTPSVTISGTPSVTGNVTILGGNVGINAAANTVQVSGTPNVNVTNAVGNPIPATITNSPSVTISGTPSVSISQTSTNNNVKITDGTDVAQIDTNGRIGTRIYGANASDVVDVSGTSLNVNLTNQPSVLNQVRTTGNTWVSERRADQFDYSEFNTLANNGSFSVYDAVFGTTWKVTVRRITISATIAGIYTFNWFSSTGAEVLMFKVRMIAGETQCFEFDGWVSPYNGGGVKVYNNTNNSSPSAVTCVVEAWEQ
jgi:hypothetical protein